MTDKQIIIDGVDVKKCVYHESGYCTISKEAYCYCCDKPNCHYKNWQRKEQECEELKKQRTAYIKEAEENFEVHTTLKDNYRKLYQTLTEIKEIAENCCINQATLDCENYDDCTQCGRISDDEGIQQILQKISEVEE